MARACDCKQRPTKRKADTSPHIRQMRAKQDRKSLKAKQQFHKTADVVTCSKSCRLKSDKLDKAILR